MQQAKELLHANRLADAIKETTADVRSHPQKLEARALLFELLAFAGEWERALKQLDVLAQLDPGNEMGVQVYRHNVRALQLRERLFANGDAPHFLTEPPTYIDLHLSALDALRQNDFARARDLFDEAEDARPVASGTADEVAFDDWRDADDAVAAVLEAIISDKYTWIPFNQITQLEIEAPQQLRDLIWARASIETIDGFVGNIFVPVLYHDSAEQENEAIKLGRMTDWIEVGANVWRGVGARLFLVGESDKTLFEINKVEFTPQAS